MAFEAIRRDDGVFLVHTHPVMDIRGWESTCIAVSCKLAEQDVAEKQFKEIADKLNMPNWTEFDYYDSTTWVDTDLAHSDEFLYIFNYENRQVASFPKCINSEFLALHMKELKYRWYFVIPPKKEKEDES